MFASNCLLYCIINLWVFGKLRASYCSSSSRERALPCRGGGMLIDSNGSPLQLLSPSDPAARIIPPSSQPPAELGIPFCVHVRRLINT
ncbi:hypothetical protein CEXT_697511 [Caerostris extrusa]|uniref:Secreted protein n=1 Tax=Caerostris extrusa TaxID=172846 RepID=A0AAV4Y2I2_CAEEX|nr:hypothetical protein CEXT_697511 [Caerostris extrusa]